MKTTGLRLLSIVSACLAFIVLAAGGAPARAESGGSPGTALSRVDQVRVAYAAYRRAGRRRGGRAAAASAGGGRFFVDFRARYALSYGHSYVAYGRLDGRGQIIESHVAGLHPAGDSSVPWMIGHFIPVPSETGPSDGDLESKYIAASYRVTMNEAEYSRMVVYIKQLQATSPLWNAILYNCNTFAGRIASHIGLQSPSVTLVYPATYINAMRDLNHGQSALSGNAS